MTAELSINHQSSSPSLDGGSVNSPLSRRQNLPSLWTQVVRGEPESVPAQSPIITDSDSGSGQTVAAAADESQVVGSSSDGGNVAGGGSKKAVWKKPLNVAADTTSPVMGADTDSWPALSESTRPLPKSSSTESSSKHIPDIPISPPPPPPQGLIISHTPHKPAKANANTNSSSHNHGHPFRQKSMKRSGSAGFTRPPPPTPHTVPTPPPLPPPFPTLGMSYPNLVPPVLDGPVRGEGVFNGNGSWTTGRPMGDHSSHRNPSRRGNFGGGRPRGNAPYANGYGGRNDHDWDRHGPRGSNARDVHTPHQIVPPPPHAPRGFVRPHHPGAPPFIAPQPMRPLMYPMGFDMTAPYMYFHALPPETFRGGPLMAHTGPVFYPVIDPTLHTSILNQIEYYFSESNLVKDNYLRSNMDDEAWVPVSLIANFPRVQNLTTDIQLILDILRNSTVVEVQGDKIRPRKEWKKWAPTPGNLLPAELGARAGSSDNLLLPTSFQKLVIDEATDAGLTSEQSKLADGDVIAEPSSSNI